MIREIDGDIFDPEFGFEAIGHGVNCYGRMGAGFAKEVARRFPEMLPSYREHCASGALRPGGVWPYSVSNELRIYNIASQDAPGRNADYGYLWSGVSKSLIDCWNHGIKRLALPAIGCGIGGLDWHRYDRNCDLDPDTVLHILQYLNMASPVEIIVVHDKGRPAPAESRWKG